MHSDLIHVAQKAYEPRRSEDSMKRLMAAAAIAIGTFAIALPAGASTQTIDATLTSTLSMTSSPTASVSGWVLASTGANTTSGGSIGINSNQPYTVAVTGDKSRLTEYVTGTSSYVASSPKTLTGALSVVAARSAGTALVPGVAATAIVGTSSALAVGTGLGTDTFDVTLSQPTLIVDPALPAGETYHIVLTYTLSSTL
jgi:hypothetical protein